MISKNKVVAIHYRLHEDNAEGSKIEETGEGQPLSFLFGVGQMIPSFENHLEGKKTGDAFEFTLSPQEAYGLYDEDAVLEFAIDNFKDENGNIDEEKIKVGEPINIQDTQGRSFYGLIVDMEDDVVVIDFNHAMAGLTLHFVGEVMEVRDATASEIDHGHVH